MTHQPTHGAQPTHKAHQPRIIPHANLGHETHMAWYPIATHGLPAKGWPPPTHDPPATHGRQAYEPHMAYVPNMTKPAHMPASCSHMFQAPPHTGHYCCATGWSVGRLVVCGPAGLFFFLFALQTPLQNKICCVCIIIRALFVCLLCNVSGRRHMGIYTRMHIYISIIGIR